jgi:hypothetical protein
MPVMRQETVRHCVRKTLIAAVALAVALVACKPSSVETAFANHSSGVEVQGAGTVAALLPDDVKGGRHQRFIVRLDSGTTLLISHNIDVAPRVSSLRVGDRIAFAGEYVWNAKGGLIHWTHRDPSGHHNAGWVKHNGETFQ